MAKILLSGMPVRWFRRALILAVCTLAATCTPSGPSIINPQVEPPSATGTGGRVVTPGAGGRVNGGGAPGTGGSSAAGAAGAGTGGFASGAGGGSNGGATSVDASVAPDSGGPPFDGGSDAADAGTNDGAIFDAETPRD